MECSPVEATPITTSSGSIARPSMIRSRLDHADAKAGQVVIAGGVDVGQDGRLAAEQGAVGLDAAVA